MVEMKYRPTLTDRDYIVTLTDTGQWMHAPGTDFLFAYIANDWSSTLKDAVAKAFTHALTMSSVIKRAVLDTSGQAVVNGLYLLDQAAMTTAMNSIDGMGETDVNTRSFSRRSWRGLAATSSPSWPISRTRWVMSRRRLPRAMLPPPSAR
jgi:hypothetical protein